MSELTELTIAEARDGLVNRKFSSVELTDVHIRAVEAARDLNAFVTETLDLAIERAKASDDRRAKGKPAGGMDGIPIAVKDLFCTNLSITQKPKLCFVSEYLLPGLPNPTRMVIILIPFLYLLA